MPPPNSEDPVFPGVRGSRGALPPLKRNASVVLGNIGSSEDVTALVAALDEPEPLVRGHAAWALAKIGSPEAQAALGAETCSARLESITEVRVELMPAMPTPQRTCAQVLLPHVLRRMIGPFSYVEAGRSMPCADQRVQTLERKADVEPCVLQVTIARAAVGSVETLVHAA